jgi:uncharacterized repeat protein (TIGR04138 family)
MHEVIFEEAIEKIRAKDPRYHRDAYHFVREALDQTKKSMGKKSDDPVLHVTGQELLEGIRELALKQFGPMTLMLFEEWGIKSCQDFGEVVFNMVDIGLLAKTKTDSRADFQNGFDFQTAFRQPFLPSSSQTMAPPQEASEAPTSN